MQKTADAIVLAAFSAALSVAVFFLKHVRRHQNA